MPHISWWVAWAASDVVSLAGWSTTVPAASSSSHGGGASSPEALQLIEELERAGAQCHVLKFDVTDTQKLSAVLGTLLSSLPPLRGVIQGAMVLRGAVFASMSHDTFVSVLKPKVHGSLALHVATTKLNAPLDFFVMLSSAAAFVGNARQFNYVAGCTCQSALARYRRRQLHPPAVAIDIGKVAGVGFVAEHAGTVSEANLNRLGMPDISETELLAVLDTSIKACKTGEEANAMYEGDEEHFVTGVTELARVVSNEEELPFWSRDPIFSHPAYVCPSQKAGGVNGQDDSSADANSEAVETVSLREVVADQGSMDETALLEKVLISLTQSMAKALILAPSDMDITKSPAELGADSLVGVEIRIFFAREAEVDVLVFDVLGAPNLISIAKIVAKAIKGVK